MMGTPRKVFRIEESTASPPAPVVESDHAGLRHAEMMRELAALRAIIAVAPAANGNAVVAAGPAPSLIRMAQELEAVISGSERATQKILAAAEEIDQAANNLSAALKGKLEQGFAEDIQDLIVKIFEVCNFQDLIGQRVQKVMAALTLMNGCTASDGGGTVTAPQPGGTHSLHGPRLENDRGHATQDEIDAIFAAG